MTDQNVAGLDPNSGDGGVPPDPTGQNSAGSNNSGGFNPLSFAVPGAVAVTNWLSGQSTNDANSAEAAKNRQFGADQAEIARQYDQAKTLWQSTHGYQNAMADMKAAGLNPILAAKMGPETGSGGGGSPASAPGNPVMQNALAQGLNSGMAASDMVNSIRNTNADLLVKNASALKLASETEANTWSARSTEEGIKNLAIKNKQLESQTPAIQAEAGARVNQANIDKENAARREILNQVRLGTQSLNSAIGAIKPFGGSSGYSENDMLNAAAGRGVLTQ